MAAAIFLFALQDATLIPLGEATGHLGPVTCIRKAGNRWLSAGRDGSIKLWDMGSRKEIRSFPGHDGEVHDLASDGTVLVSAGEDKTLRVWDLSTGKELRRLEAHQVSVRATAIAGGRLVTAGADGVVIAWSLPGFEELARFNTGSTPRQIATDGKRAWVACNDALHVLDLTSKTIAAKLDAKNVAVQCVAVDDGYAAAGYLDGSVRIWSGDRVASEWKAADLAIYSIDIDGGTVVTGGQDYMVKVWNGKTLRSKFEKAHVGLVAAVGIDGGRVLSGSYDGTIGVWDPAKASPVARIEAHGGEVSAMAITSDGRLVTGGYDRSVRVWSVSGRSQTLRIDAHKGRVNAVLAAGSKLISAGDDGVIAMWDGAGKLLAEFQGHTGEAKGLALTGSGLLVTGGNDGVIRLWTPGQKKPSSELRGGSGEIDVLAVTPDGRRIVSVGSDRALRIWDVSKKKEEGRVDGVGLVYALAVTDRIAVTCGSVGTVSIVDLDKLDRPTVLGSHEGTVASGSVAKDGKLLATADRAKRVVKLWDLEARQEVRLAEPPKADFVALTPDGRTLICADRGRIRFWSIRR